MISATKRDPVRTRQQLLDSAFREVHRAGFQATDLDTILQSAGVTKGALYHHFANKEALGYALVDEVITRVMKSKWLGPLEQADNPVDQLLQIVEATPAGPDTMRYGCPLNNLAQEMSAVDEGFRARLARIFQEWIAGVADALRRGQTDGVVRADLDPQESATFFIAAYEGYLSLAKSTQDERMLTAGKRALARHLDSLRPHVPKH